MSLTDEMKGGTIYDCMAFTECGVDHIAARGGNDRYLHCAIKG